jgi:hypothetical protein
MPWRSGLPSDVRVIGDGFAMLAGACCAITVVATTAASPSAIAIRIS